MSPFGRNYDSNQRPSSGIGARLILAVIIALIGFFMYMRQVEVNPVTQEKQHVAISPDQEIRLGLESAPEMAREMGGVVSSNNPRAIEVQKLGKYLVNHSIAKNSPWKFHFHLLADPQTVNAFALPGGQIFITMGLFNKLQNEAQLAGVLAHEMGHVIERHSAQQMATNQLGQALVIAVGTAASDQSNSSYRIAAVVNQALQLSYSRQDESEADIWGLKVMSSAGFNPEAMVDVMLVLKEASKGNPGIEIFQSHPNPDLRIKQIQEYLAKNKPGPGLSEGRNLKDLFPSEQTRDKQRSRDLFSPY
ncbi:MAG: M48 family metalloprotease [Parachlamydiaceae bacterium]|nr:M48 family metalloprotease [Parachlamydiaceae bacterium]